MDAGIELKILWPRPKVVSGSKNLPTCAEPLSVLGGGAGGGRIKPEIKSPTLWPEALCIAKT